MTVTSLHYGVYARFRPVRRLFREPRNKGGCFLHLRFPTPVLPGSGLGGMFSGGFLCATPNGIVYLSLITLK